MKSSLYISVLALVVSVLTALWMFLGCHKHKMMQSVDAAQVRVALNQDPEMIISALQRYEQIQREAQMKEASRLFKANIDELNNNANTPFVGPKDAKIVLVEFFDFSCGYCKRLAPAVEAIIKNNPDVKVVFKPITFVAQISNYAAQAALAANEQGKFLEMYALMLGTNERLTQDSINAMAEKVGLDMAKFKADVAAKQTQDTINEVANLAEKLQIRGVPALVMNGTQLQVIDEAGIQAEINKLK
ncbi:MAG: thioredoxin domain-containing protein [Alphaproteobacteria bacterium]|nr:thioredoxin domain-containing protein [Alphaproteobacteria bacterium]